MTQTSVPVYDNNTKHCCQHRQSPVPFMMCYYSSLLIGAILASQQGHVDDWVF